MNTTYILHPKIINEVEKAEKENGGLLDCYLNPKNPENGAYLYLNEKVESPELRMFRWYEGWMLLVTPLAIAFAIIVFIAVQFLKGTQEASATQKPKETQFSK